MQAQVWIVFEKSPQPQLPPGMIAREHTSQSIEAEMVILGANWNLDKAKFALDYLARVDGNAKSSSCPCLNKHWVDLDEIKAGNFSKV